MVRKWKEKWLAFQIGLHPKSWEEYLCIMSPRGSGSPTCCDTLKHVPSLKPSSLLSPSAELGWRRADGHLYTTRACWIANMRLTALNFNSASKQLYQCCLHMTSMPQLCYISLCNFTSINHCLHPLSLSLFSTRIPSFYHLVQPFQQFLLMVQDGSSSISHPTYGSYSRK